MDWLAKRRPGIGKSHHNKPTIPPKPLKKGGSLIDGCAVECGPPMKNGNVPAATTAVSAGFANGHDGADVSLDVQHKSAKTMAPPPSAFRLPPQSPSTMSTGSTSTALSPSVFDFNDCDFHPLKSFNLPGWYDLLALACHFSGTVLFGPRLVSQ